MGVTAILNDLTTCLRHGDLTVVNPHGGFLIVEAKSSENRSKRTDRQELALSTIGSYLQTDEATDLFGVEGPFFRRELAYTLQDHTDLVNRLIQKAKVDGATVAQAERGLHYFISLGYHPDLLDEAVRSCRSTPIVFHVNTHKYANTGHFPFTLSIRDPNALFHFYAGDLNILVLLESDVLHYLFSRRGYSVEIDLADRYPITLRSKLLEYTDTPGIRLGGHMFNRLFVEFVSLRWLVKETVARIKSAQADFDSRSVVEHT